MNYEDFGLGRAGRGGESEDDKFPMASVVAPLMAEPLPNERYWWASGWWGNQGSKPHCVEYSWHHWLCDGPFTQGRGPLWTPGEVYTEANGSDEWSPTPHDGTSVRAGAKALQRRGFIESYWWGNSAQDVIDGVRAKGPVVVGTNWYSSMFYPNAAGALKVDGRVVGGHAYLIDGVNMRREQARIKNSWGRGWGRRGFALISFDDLDRLIREDGEACLAVERKPEAA